MHIEMNSIWRWLYNVAGRDFGGTTAAPNDGTWSPMFTSRQHGMSTGHAWFAMTFGNDSFDVVIYTQYTDEAHSRVYFMMAADDFRGLALWYLWRWAWGEWFGVRRWLWYATGRLCRRVEVTP